MIVLESRYYLFLELIKSIFLLKQLCNKIGRATGFYTTTVCFCGKQKTGCNWDYLKVQREYEVKQKLVFWFDFRTMTRVYFYFPSLKNCEDYNIKIINIRIKFPNRKKRFQFSCSNIYCKALLYVIKLMYCRF